MQALIFTSWHDLKIKWKHISDRLTFLLWFQPSRMGVFTSPWLCLAMLLLELLSCHIWLAVPMVSALLISNVQPSLYLHKCMQAYCPDTLLDLTNKNRLLMVLCGCDLSSQPWTARRAPEKRRGKARIWILQRSLRPDPDGFWKITVKS